MPNLVYKTPHFEEKVAGLGSDLRDSVNRMLERIEKNPDFVFDQTRNNVSSKRIGNQDNNAIGFRFGSRRFPGWNLFCFFEFRGEMRGVYGGQLNEWMAALRRPDDLTEEFMEEYIRTHKGSESDGGREKPTLPPEYSGWLSAQKYSFPEKKDPLELVVRETKAWRESVLAPLAPENNAGAAIRTLLGELYMDSLDNDRITPASLRIEGLPVSDDCYCLEAPPNWKILCEYKLLEDGRRTLTLIDVRKFGENDPEFPVWARSAFEDYFAKKESMFPLRRDYPGIFLDPENGTAHEKWLKIENNDVANISMSDEEMDILKALTSNPKTMPTFINGPAGSGKSTILQYLFAHYWLQKDLQGDDYLAGNPLFLTLSEKLLENARSATSSILALDADNLSQNDDEVRKKISPSFVSFRQLLARIIGEQECERRFPADGEIDFETFRKLLDENGNGTGRRFAMAGYRGEPLRQIATPELCWHIIRSYIKGYSPEGYLSAETFRGLRGRDVDPFVDDSEFTYISQKVWPWYRKLTVEVDRNDETQAKLWDQQDLAREALQRLEERRADLPENLRSFTAIFCDEAQDLTGVELRIVQKISLLSEYDLSSVSNGASLPFAFAADPMQTLNPSGFRWQNLKSSIWQNLIKPLMPGPSQRSVGMETQTLSFNYRSPKLITLFSNLVQLSRKCLFGGSVKAQRPYDTREGTPRFRKFDRNAENPLTDRELQSLSGSIVVLPCSSGRELEMIEEFPILRQIREFDPRQSFVSVMSVKGMDIKNVVVFGFGEVLFPVPLPAETSGTSRDIALSYAMNKLYVAVSRSTDNLLILDTEKGASNLWYRLGDLRYRDACLDSLRKQAGSREGDSGDSRPADLDAWTENLPSVPFYAWECQQFADVFRELSAADLENQGDNLFADAKAQKSYSLMIQAANFFAKAARRDKQTRCEAFAEEFRGDCKRAAEKFDAIADSSDAERCLWAGCLWQELRDRPRATVRKRLVAKFMASDVSDETVSEFLAHPDREDAKPTREDYSQFKAVFGKLEEYAASLLETEEWSSARKQTAADLVRYFDQNVSWFPQTKTTTFCLSVKLALSPDYEEFWSFAQKCFRPESDPGKTVFWTLYRAHRGIGDEFVKACRTLDDFKLFLDRKNSCGMKGSDWRNLDSSTKEWIASRHVKNGKAEEALRFAVESAYFGCAARCLEALSPDIPFDLAKELLQSMARENAWAEMEEAFKIVLDSVSIDGLGQLAELLATSASVRESKTGGYLARLLSDRANGFTTWPRSPEDLYRMGRLLDSFNEKEPLETLGKTWMVLGATDSLAVRKAAVRVFLRSKRKQFDETRKREGAAENVLQEAKSAVLGSGLAFSDADWEESRSPLPVPVQPVQNSAAPSIADLQKTMTEASERGDFAKVAELLAEINKLRS